MKPSSKNNAVYIMQVWPGGPYEEMAQMARQRNIDYCNAHGFDFEFLVGVVSEKYGSYSDGSWVKVEMIQRALAKGYQYVVFLEPDTLIRDMDADLRDGCPNGIGACWHRPFAILNLPSHWNVGALYMQNTQAVKDFVDEWLARFPGDKQWREQGVFDKLGLEGKIIQTISDRWCSTINVNMVPDAVVLGFHGAGGDGEGRLNLMRQAFKIL